MQVTIFIFIINHFLLFIMYQSNNMTQSRAQNKSMTFSMISLVLFPKVEKSWAVGRGGDKTDIYRKAE